MVDPVLMAVSAPPQLVEVLFLWEFCIHTAEMEELGSDFQINLRVKIRG